MKAIFDRIGEILTTSSINSALTWDRVLVTLIVATLLSVFIAVVYVLTNRKNGYSAYFVTSLIILPPVIAAIITMIGTNLASAISLGGVFALIRFRSEPGNPRDITFICVTMAAGLACGMGFMLIAAVIVLFVMVVFILISLSGFGMQKRSAVVLKITIPEDLDFEVAFEDTFKKYTKYHTLDRVKTADFGALFQLQYRTELKDNSQRREFLDALRAINSNLTVALSSVVYEEGRKTF